MRNLLAFVAAVALTFTGVGWYLDWFHIQRGPVSSDGHQNVNIDVNTVKIARDVHRGVQAGERKIEEIIDKSNQTTNKSPGDVTRLDAPPPAKLPTPVFPGSTVTPPNPGGK